MSYQNTRPVLQATKLSVEAMGMKSLVALFLVRHSLVRKLAIKFRFLSSVGRSITIPV